MDAICHWVLLCERQIITLERWQIITLERWQIITLERWQIITLERWQIINLERWQIITLERWQIITLERWQIITLERWQIITLERWQIITLERWQIITLERWQIRGAGMVQWWEHSPPTHVSQVRFPNPASLVGWVCCWFSSLLRGFFWGFSGFSPSTKINTSKLWFDLETVDEEPLRGNATINSNLFYYLFIDWNALSYVGTVLTLFILAYTRT